MRINVVKWVNVLQEVEKDKAMLRAFLKFYSKLRSAEWRSPNDVFKTFRTADLIQYKKSNRIVFNVGGNRYRLIVGYYFGQSLINLYVKYVGTHKDYDDVDACEVNMFGNG